MPYEQLQALEATEVKRFTGVQRATVEEMVGAVGEDERHQQTRGRPSTLSVADHGLGAVP